VDVAVAAEVDALASARGEGGDGGGGAWRRRWEMGRERREGEEKGAAASRVWLRLVGGIFRKSPYTSTFYSALLIRNFSLLHMQYPVF
jgi:hypothetical protein